MKKITIVLITILTVFTSIGQSITGQWLGVLKVQGTQLKIVFHITETENGYKSTMDSPDQGAKGIPVTSTTFENSTLKLEVANIGIEYNGELKNDTITGVFKQKGYEFPLNLSRDQIEKQALKRAQEPVPPYPYYTEEVSFQNKKAGITLAGTLTLPQKEGNFPAVVLITGSGPQNRDEEILGHKPFLVIADHLTKNGIAVLRFDDRGVGQSTGDFKSATSLDFASDVEEAIAYLKTRKEINKNKIGLIGHSEGGMIAPIIASESKDVNFIVLLAGPGIRGNELLLLQQELIAKASGVSESDIKKTKAISSKAFDMVLKSENTQTLQDNLTKYLQETLMNDSSGKAKSLTDSNLANLVSTQVNQMLSPWMQYFIKYDPANTLEKVRCPVLAVNGGKDLQVASKENLTAIKNALEKGGNKKVAIKEYPGLNHLLQECKTGLPGEYAEIQQTFSPLVLDDITKWIIAQTK